MTISKSFENKVENAISAVGSQRENIIHPLLLEAVFLTIESRNTNYISLVLNRFETVSNSVTAEQFKKYFTSVANFKISIVSKSKSFKVSMHKGFDYSNTEYVDNLRASDNRYWKLKSTIVKPKKVCDFLKVMNGVEVQLARTLNLGLADEQQIKALLETTLNKIVVLSSSEKVLGWCSDYSDEQAIETETVEQPGQTALPELTEQQVLDALVIESAEEVAIEV